MELQYEYWLFQVKRLGSSKKIRLVEAVGTAKKIYELSSKELETYKPLLSKNNIEGIQMAKEMIQLESYKQLAEQGISFAAFGGVDYPKRLSKIQDPPYGILYRGKLPSDKERTLAMIGARECSEYGKYVAREFAAYLAPRGIQVISGLARGIDGISQQAALEAGGYSLGVLGSGVDICYPREHRRIYEDLIQRGGILSEFPLGTAPKAQLFPARNRIISALSDGLLVIEAKQKSGTLITVDQALEQGKDVYAIPGKIVESLSYGCNYLIKQGATIILSPKDLYDELTLGVGHYQWEGMERKIPTIHRTPMEEAVYQALDSNPQTVDSICEKLNHMELVQVQCELLKLVLEGDALQVSGNLFQKKYR